MLVYQIDMSIVLLVLLVLLVVNVTVTTQTKQTMRRRNVDNVLAIDILLEKINMI